MTDGFYRAFEDRYRGSRELIKERLRAYLPFTQPFFTLTNTPNSLDLGCGRGEWLELLSEEGFQATGVDLNDRMLEACFALGLNARKGDALDALREMPSASVSIVSAFHVVEHIGFKELLALVKEATRVLIPGGLLILETPNPENLLVGSCNFYLDPSHKQPIPPALLGFVAEYSGFSRVKMLRLQESSILRDPAAEVRLFDVLSGVSPDYAIVAQTSCDEDVSRLFDGAFSADFGLSLSVLTDRYEAQSARSENALAEKINQSNEKISQLIEQIRLIDQGENALTVQISQSNEKITQLIEQIHLIDQGENSLAAQINQSNGRISQLLEQIQLIEAETQRLGHQLQAVYTSTSWRLTKPLRWLRGRFK